MIVTSGRFNKSIHRDTINLLENRCGWLTVLNSLRILVYIFLLKVNGKVLISTDEDFQPTPLNRNLLTHLSKHGQFEKFVYFGSIIPDIYGIVVVTHD